MLLPGLPLRRLAVAGGPTGTLQHDSSASFTGTVAGITGQDTIDFANIDPTKVQQSTYSGTAAGGTLSVTDGSHNTNIALIGNYLASSFVASSDTGAEHATIVAVIYWQGSQPHDRGHIYLSIWARAHCSKR
jgi:hypothetical protein